MSRIKFVTLSKGYESFFLSMEIRAYTKNKYSDYIEINVKCGLNAFKINLYLYDITLQAGNDQVKALYLDLLIFTGSKTSKCL